MNNKKTLEKVIRRVILPNYPMLEDVDVSIMGGAMNMYFYLVSYTVEKHLDLKLAQEITRETNSLYQMIGEPIGNDITVYFYERKKN